MILLSWLASLGLKPGDAVSPAEMIVHCQDTFYRFAELGSGIDYLLEQDYLERREGPEDVLYLTRTGFELLSKMSPAPEGSDMPT